MGLEKTTVERIKRILQPAVAEWIEEHSQHQKTRLEEMQAQVDELRVKQTQRMEQLMSDAPQGRKGEVAPEKLIADMLRAIKHGGRDHEKAHEFAQKGGYHEVVLKALSSNIGTEGAYTVPDVLSGEFIELRRARSVVMAAGPRVIPLDGGNLSMAKLTGGSTSEFIGENTGQNASQQTVGQIKLSAKKQRTTVPASNELLRRSSISTDQMITQEVTSGMAQRRDQAYLRDDGTADTPVGIRFSAVAAQITASNAANDASVPTSAEVEADFRDLLDGLDNSDVMTTKPHIFMAPRSKNFLKFLRQGTSGDLIFPEMRSATMNILGIPVSHTNNLPINLGAGTDGESEIMYVNMDDMLVGEETDMLVSVSDEATYRDASGNLVSAYDLDQSVWRFIENHDMKMRHDEAIAVKTNVVYGAR